MGTDARDGRRGVATLLRDLVDGSVALMRGELRLAKLEVAAILEGIGVGTAFVAAGAVCALIGALCLLVGFVLLLGDQWLPADMYWLGALILLVITGTIAAWFAKRGMALLSPSQLTPDETVNTLKEDKEWLKRQLTSGAISS